MLHAYDDAPFHAVDFEDLSLPNQIAILFGLPRLDMSRKDIVSVPATDLAHTYRLPVEKVNELKALMALCENYHQIRKYEEALDGMDERKVAKYFLEEWGGLKYEKMAMLFYGEDNKLQEVVEWNGTFDLANFDFETVHQTVRSNNSKTVLVLHNHPTGVVKPTKRDISATKSLIQAGMDFGFAVSDHMIIGKTKYYSFKSDNLLEEILEELEMEAAHE